VKRFLARVVVAATSVALAQPGFAQPAQPERHGLTFEAGLGVGGLFVFANGNDAAQGGHVSGELGVAAPSVRVGVWQTPRLALTLRLAAVTVAKGGGADTNAFLGPAFQFWITDRLWSGGGLGLSYLQATSGTASYAVNDKSPYSALGVAMHFRSGYTFNPCSANTLNASLEVDPSFYFAGGNASWTFTSVSLVFGYQYL
jgi:hypothetical protein